MNNLNDQKTQKLNNVDYKNNNTNFENQNHEKNKYKEMEQEIISLKCLLEEKNREIKEKDSKINKLMRKLDNVIEENSILKEKSKENMIKLKEKEKEIDHGFMSRRSDIFSQKIEEKEINNGLFFEKKKCNIF